MLIQVTRIPHFQVWGGGGGSGYLFFYYCPPVKREPAINVDMANDVIEMYLLANNFFKFVIVWS